MKFHSARSGGDVNGGQERPRGSLAPSLFSLGHFEMETAELLRAHNIKVPDTKHGRYYTTCPNCSSKRSRSNQTKECLGVTIYDKGAMWGCSHCGWTGPSKGNGQSEDTQFTAIYDYVDEDGALLFQVCRKPDKGFLQRRPDGNVGWTWKTGEVRKLLYRLPELTEAIANERTVLIV